MVSRTLSQWPETTGPAAATHNEPARAGFTGPCGGPLNGPCTGMVA
jgi:hypothetical protein